MTIAVAALMLVLSMAPSALARDLPPITAEPTGATLAGKVVWYELITDDVDGAKTFYGALFGWRFESRGAGSNYTLITAKGRRIGGIVARDGSHERLPRTIWIPVISVADVDSAVARIEAVGGTVLERTHNSASRGRLALVRGAGGIPLTVLASASGDPRDDPVAVGQWTVPTLLTRNRAKAMAFYTSVFGYEEAEAKDPAGFRFGVLKSVGRVRMTVFESHMLMNRIYPTMGAVDNFVPFVFQASDAAADVGHAFVERATGLGARVLVVRPTDVVILDPQGAVVGLDFLDPAFWDNRGRP